MLSKITYGERLYRELGNTLAQWNHKVAQGFDEAFFAFWPVDIFPFRENPQWTIVERR
jgi:hypothetical protein